MTALARYVLFTMRNRRRVFLTLVGFLIFLAAMPLTVCHAAAPSTFEQWGMFELSLPGPTISSVQKELAEERLDMIARFREAGLPVPNSRQNGWQFVQILPWPTSSVNPEVTPEVARLLPLCAGPRTRKDLQEALRLRDDEHFRIAYLLAAIEIGYPERTIPEKPTSRLQKYRLTEKGRAWLTTKTSTTPRGDAGQ